MEVVIVPDAKAGGELIAEAMAQLLRRKPDALLGVATGSTPLPIYEALAAKVGGGEVDASKARIAQLDEYVGLPTGHPESYRATVLREVVEPLGLSEGSFMGPDGSAEDVQAACEAYDKALAAAGGVDLQLLGIGTDGHIGFNEPCSSIASRTRIKTLTAADHRGQRALLRRRPRPGAAPRHHAGHRHDPGGAASGAARHRRGQGGRRGGDRRGAGRLAWCRLRRFSCTRTRRSSSTRRRRRS